MKATIWHNPKCSKSRNTLAILQETPDVEVEIVEYLKNPPSREELARVYEKAGMHPQAGLRTSGTDAKERGLTEDGISADAVLDAMAADPKLIERPVVETQKGARLCRPPENVTEIL